MSIETSPELTLDELLGEANWRKAIHSIEERNLPVVTLTGALDSFRDAEKWGRLKECLLDLRSSNVSAILLLQRGTGDVFLEDDEVNRLFAFLKDWDQFLLHNFIEVCEDWVPNVYQPVLRSEAKIELKWFKEWLMATVDQRIHKYPGLPWRSFIRKINGENFRFATQFLELTAAPASPENIQAVQKLFNDFLEAKKKVVCTFPKHWNRGNA